MFSNPTSPGIHHLRGILHAYALYNPILGYTQGMGFLVGMLLMHIIEPEHVFWCLVTLLNGPAKGFYESELKQVRMDARAFDVVLKGLDSRLARHLESNQIDALMYIPQWFLTLFTTSLPWSSVLRVWDMFIFEGPKTLFRIGLAILISSKRKTRLRHTFPSTPLI
ncbi:hypothetical protein HDU98_010221 [Podochytrium sp. JEL0797]|nr:hypothetical protein HDU98_010221 [Podochytrium sp. JEL0797]